MSMHLRFKRRTTTVFLHVDPAESFLSLRERLALTINAEPSAVQLVMPDRRKEYADLATVSDQGLQSDDVVFFVLQKETGGWEEVAESLAAQ